MSTIGSAAPAILPAPKFIPHAVRDDAASSLSSTQQSASVAQSAVTRAAGQLDNDARSQAPAVKLSGDALAISAKQQSADLAASNVRQVQAKTAGLNFTV